MCKVPLCLLDKLLQVKWAKEIFFKESKTLCLYCSCDEQQRTISIDLKINSVPFFTRKSDKKGTELIFRSIYKK